MPWYRLYFPVAHPCSCGPPMTRGEPPNAGRPPDGEEPTSTGEPTSTEESTSTEEPPYGGRPPNWPGPLAARFQRVKELKVGGIVESGIWLVRDLVHVNTCIERAIEPTAISNGKAEEEIRIMKILSHENFVRYIESFICLAHRIPSASIFMEAPQFGTLEDLFEKYKRRKKRICEAFIWDLYSQLINALGYLQHGIQCIMSRDVPGPAAPNWERIVHCDIHCGNIFLAAPPVPRASGYPLVKLGNFSLSTNVPDNQLYKMPELPDSDQPSRTFGLPDDIYRIGIAASMATDPSIILEYRNSVPVDKYTHQLGEAIKYVLNEDWTKRPSIISVGLNTVRLKREANYPVESLPTWAGLSGGNV